VNGLVLQKLIHPRVYRGLSALKHLAHFRNRKKPDYWLVLHKFNVLPCFALGGTSSKRSARTSVLADQRL